MNQPTTSGSAALLATLLATLVGLLRVCWPGLLFVWPCCWSAQAGEKQIIAITRSGLLSKGPFGLLLEPRRLLEQNQELGRAGGDACCTGGLDPAFTCVGTVLSSSARTTTQARLMRKARVRADSTRVRSTNDTSLRMSLKKETLLPCSGSQSPTA